MSQDARLFENARAFLARCTRTRATRAIRKRRSMGLGVGFVGSENLSRAQ